jgi:acyl-CoA synthetase (AMP-forming)/AMP-acid ligase II
MQPTTSHYHCHSHYHHHRHVIPGISSNGLVNEGVELKLVPVLSADSGTTLYSPADRPCPRGEIHVRRADGTVPSYYWRRPDLQAAAWTEDGWYATGDVGELDYRAVDGDTGERILQPNVHAPRPARCHHFSRGQGGGVPQRGPGTVLSAAPPLLRIIDRVQSLVGSGRVG